jgi:hypothetical protein
MYDKNDLYSKQLSTIMALQSETKFISSHSEGAVYLDPVKNHHLFISTGSHQRNDIICHFTAREICITPSRFTVQADETKHILLSPEHLQYINHSCRPNAFFDVDNLQLVALREIEEGDEITFFYPSSEWKMSETFTCNCGEHNCLGAISGAANIPKSIINQYKLTQFIQSKLNKDH